jgi:hypothetical protein
MEKHGMRKKPCLTRYKPLAATLVIPAKAEIQKLSRGSGHWITAFAGMMKLGLFERF